MQLRPQSSQCPRAASDTVRFHTLGPENAGSYSRSVSIVTDQEYALAAGRRDREATAFQRWVLEEGFELAPLSFECGGVVEGAWGAGGEAEKGEVDSVGKVP